jgi:hypothetical protein
MDNQTKDQIRDFVAYAKLDKALEMLGNWAKLQGDKDLQNMVIGKQGELRTLKKEIDMGIIDSGDASVKRNKIAGAILSMLDDAEEGLGNEGNVAAAAVGKKINDPHKNDGTILFLAANPTDTAKLQLEKEFIQILKNLDEKDVSYTLKSEFAVTASLLQSALLKYEPRILHFSGHGDGGKGDVPPSGGDMSRAIGLKPSNRSGIVLQTSDGSSQLVSGKALANLFSVCLEIFKLEVVILNACSSEEQALAISNAGVPYVIGMNASVKDLAAIQFSAKFYEGLASRGNVDIAFKLAKAGVMMENSFANGADIPVLYKRTV